MQFREWYDGQSNLFSEILKIENFVFLGDDVDNLESVYLMMFGNKCIPENVKNMTTTSIAKIIVTSYKNKWNDLYELREDDLLKGVGNRETKSIIENRENEETANSDNSNKVSAFNEVDFTESDNSSNETINTGSGNIDRQEEVIKTDFKIIKQQLELLENTFVLDVVFIDIKNMLSLSIY